MNLFVFKIVLGISIVALLALLSLWWVNGQDDTWYYVIAAIIVLTSLFSAKPRKK